MPVMPHRAPAGGSSRRCRCRWRPAPARRHRGGRAAADEPPGTLVVSQGFGWGRGGSFVGGAHGELVHVGLADHHRAGGLSRLTTPGVVGATKLASIFEPQVVSTPRCRRCPCGRGDAGERAGAAGGQARVGGAAAAPGRRPDRHGDEGVDLAVAGFDAGEAVGGQFDGGDGFGAARRRRCPEAESIMGWTTMGGDGAAGRPGRWRLTR